MLKSLIALYTRTHFYTRRLANDLSGLVNTVKEKKQSLQPHSQNNLKGKKIELNFTLSLHVLFLLRSNIASWGHQSHR